jgi:hypothetical protein
MQRRAIQLAAILLLLCITIVLTNLTAKFSSFWAPEVGAVFWIGVMGALLLALLPHPEDWRLVGCWLLTIYLMQMVLEAVLGISYLGFWPQSVRIGALWPS